MGSIPIPSARVTVFGETIERLTYKDVPVVTFEMVARVHKISVETVRGSFHAHRKHFTKDKHYFRLAFAEANKLLVAQPVSRNGLIVLTMWIY